MKKDTNSDNVRVVVRCRPLSQKEKDTNCSLAISCDEIRGTVTIKQEDNRSNDPPKVFTYDRVFGPESKQTDVYNDAARAIVESVLEGYNGNANSLFEMLFYNKEKICTQEGTQNIFYGLRYNFCIWSNRNWKNIHNGRYPHRA